MKKFLFVGGPWDGKREEVSESHRVIKVAEPLKWDSKRMEEDLPFVEHIYEKRMFSSDGETCFAFFHSSIPSSQLIRKLIDGYAATT